MDCFQSEWAHKLRYQLETTIFRYFHMIRENMAVEDKYSAVLLKARLKEQKQHQVKTVAGDESMLLSSHYQKQFHLLTKTFRKVRRLLRETRESYGRLLSKLNRIHAIYG